MFTQFGVIKGKVAGSLEGSGEGFGAVLDLQVLVGVSHRQLGVAMQPSAFNSLQGGGVPEGGGGGDLGEQVLSFHLQFLFNPQPIAFNLLQSTALSKPSTLHPQLLMNKYNKNRTIKNNKIFRSLNSIIIL